MRSPGATAVDPGPPPSGAAGPVSGPTAPHESSAWALLRLAVGVAAAVALFLLAHLGALLIVIVAIMVMVMVHELGHFLAAKWGRMKVSEFFVGFGPRLWSVRRGETEYGIKAIPAGGYVKIPGMSNMEQIDPADEERTYRRQPFHKRIVVACAGSFTHFVMAVLLAYGALLSFGAPTSALEAQVTGFAHWAGRTHNAAQRAGLRVGDLVRAVDGKGLSGANQFEDIVNRSAGKPLRLTVDRHGRTLHLVVVPAVGHLVGTTGEALGPGKSGSVGLIGVETQVQSVLSPEGPVRAVGTALIDVGRDTAATVRAVPEGISNLYASITNAKVAAQSAQNGTRAESIVGAVRTATQAEQSGTLYLIEILIALNIAFGLLNMLPMLPLDGGHVAIALYERVRTRPGKPYYQADVSKLLPVVYAFAAALLVVVLAALYLDIVHPVANPFR